MKRLWSVVLIAALACVLVPNGAARQLAGQQVQVQQGGNNPIYKITINVVERTTKAINYRVRSGATKVDFRGTPLLPEARGEAKVESKQGYIEIEVEFDDLQAATRFGPEFLTYVMWAISPEGRATNLGEVILNGTKSKLDVTSELQAFGLIVTAAENEDSQHLRERSGELGKLLISGKIDNSIGLFLWEIADTNLNPVSGEPTAVQLKTAVVILNRVLPGYFDYQKRLGPPPKP